MNKRRTYFLFSLTISSIALLLLVTGSSILLIPVLTEPPFLLGNLITWAGFIALPSAVLFSSKSISKPSNRHGFAIQKTLKLLILLGFCWGIMGYFLSGNWTNTFGNSGGFQGSTQASNVFWALNYLLAILPILVLLLAVVLNWLLKKE